MRLESVLRQISNRPSFHSFFCVEDVSVSRSDESVGTHSSFPLCHKTKLWSFEIKIELHRDLLSPRLEWV